MLKSEQKAKEELEKKEQISLEDFLEVEVSVTASYIHSHSQRAVLHFSIALFAVLPPTLGHR